MMRNKYYKNRLSIKEVISSRKSTVLVFLIAFLLSAVYLVTNFYGDNFLIKYISENLWLQTIMMFLTVAGCIGIFYPFSIRKELTKEEVINSYKEKLRLEAENEKRKKTATFN